ncbi:hypothetical protein [Variovorax paradoxus]|uniref:Uncharacterized protein n=1 Tax=Variovorax paradoxus TaxID=34073 RepID=A0A0H2LY66_VARPD|nr:hypothetical protein [Variovorax paradoxus]KLN54716.1 hypothetical protein VPARA_40200 [Variovorax paradoxus]
MFSSTPTDHQHLIDTSSEPRLSDTWHSQESEIQWLRSKVLSLQLQLAGRPKPPKLTEWTAAVLGVVGAILLSTNFHPGWGFAWFLASNAVWIKYALRARAFGLLAQQAAFTITSLCGLWVWWLGALFMESDLVGLLARIAGKIDWSLVGWVALGLQIVGLFLLIVCTGSGVLAHRLGEERETQL